MDQQKLRTLVFEKTGVKIDVDDPVFALVALNEAVLAEAVERHVALLDDATAELAGRLRDSGISVSSASLSSSTAAAAAAAPVTAEKRTIAIAGGAAVLGAVLVLLGQAILFRPAPVPIVQTKELSDEQASALRNGEKLARIVQKLDAKTRDKIQAELQKP
jgi:hypothetical protein